MLALSLAVAGCRDARPAPEARADSAGAGATGEIGAAPSRGGPGAPAAGWLIGPTPDSDLLDGHDTEAGLRLRFGAATVKAESIHVGEGEFESGTVLFPDDSTRRIEILWRDTVARAEPRAAIVRGAASVWRAYPGIGPGTDLRTVESFNGRAFNLSGFGWDYGGNAGDWAGGRLDTLWRDGTTLGAAVTLRFDTSHEPREYQLVNQVSGDRVFSSSHPAMQALNPRVYELIVGPR